MKIIGIGLPRTATTSLHTAFEQLGYQSKHSNHQLHPDVISDMTHPSYHRYECFCDTPYYYLYEQMDEAFPESKFILTYRPLNKWLKSFENLYNIDGSKWIENTNTHHERFFGQRKFDVSKWSDVYYQHHSNIFAYFKDRADLMKIDITSNTSDENWDSICDFLGKKKPSNDFPSINHLNE